MQTFVPTDSSVEIASILNNADLLESITVAHRILKEMHRDGDPTPYSLSPLFKMWDGHDPALAGYALNLAEEIERRRFWPHISSTPLGRLIEDLTIHLENAVSGEYTLDYPKWWSDPKVHLAHRSELIRNDPEYYYKYWPTVSMDIVMFWPAA